MSKENKDNNVTKRYNPPEQRGLQPGTVPNIVKPPYGGSNVQKPSNQK